MHLELATVISCDPNGCRVTSLESGLAFETRYSALIQDQVKIRPGQLIALDMESAVPEVIWRWYRARIVETGPSQVFVEERERKLSVARVPGMEISESVGVEIWVTNMEGSWELHDKVIDGKPSDPSRLREKVFPRIAALLSK